MQKAREAIGYDNAGRLKQSTATVSRALQGHQVANKLAPKTFGVTDTNGDGYKLAICRSPNEAANSRDRVIFRSKRILQSYTQRL